VQITRDEPGHALKLAGALEIRAADELRNALRDLIAEDAAPAVDLSGVESCDTAALQLLCAAQRSSAASGKTLRVAGVSGAVREACEALGLPLSEVQGAI
jgi:anti-anti-sigma factor